MKKKRSNVFGIIGLCLGWIIPIAGIILGIIALIRKEKTNCLGWLSIIESLVFWLFWYWYFWL